MRADPAVENFLGRWLAARLHEPAAAGIASHLNAALPSLIRGEASERFRAGLVARVSGLKLLVERLERDDAPAPPPQSVRGRWLRNARRVVARWDESRWVASGLELTDEANPLFLAAVSQSLDEAVAGGLTSGQSPEPVRKLRALDGREFHTVPLPPGPGSSWDPSAYLFPAIGRVIAARLERVLADPARNAPPGSAPPAAALALSELIRLVDAGWPVALHRLEGALTQLAALSPDGSEFSAALREISGPECSGSPPSLPPPSEVPDAPAADPARLRASRGLDDLARKLLSDPSAEARAFGGRLKDLDALPGSDSPDGLHQAFVGCLAALDGGGGAEGSGRWRGATLDRLARMAEDLGGGETLGDRLIGHPLGRWADFVTVVGYDDPDPHGEPRRITRVERVGYLLVFSDGTRKALVRARVRIAP